METNYYTYPQEVWDAKKCAQMAKKIQKDGMGTPYPFKGYIPGTASSSIVYQGGYGKQRYNGGIVFDDKWYPGAIRHLPQIDQDYEIINVPTWGKRIRKIGQP